MKTKFLGNIHPAVVSVWAAIVAAGHIFPTVPILGTSGTFSLVSALSPLSGIFFGPVAGALCSAVGGFVGSLIAPYTAWLGPFFTFILPATTAFTTGCIAWGRWPPVRISAAGNFIFNGALIVYIIGVILWFSQEIGRSVLIYPLIYYGLGFLAMLAGIIFTARLLKGSVNTYKFPAIWLSAFGGLIGGATVGNFFALVIYRQPREFWLGLTLVSPVERAIFAAGAAFIGVPLMAGLNKVGIFVGPQDEEDG